MEAELVKRKDASLRRNHRARMRVVKLRPQHCENVCWFRPTSLLPKALSLVGVHVFRGCALRGFGRQEEGIGQ